MRREALTASWLLATLVTAVRAQSIPEPHPRPAEREPEYDTVKVDPATPPYRRLAALSGRIEGGHQDTTKWITERWAAAFKRIYPNVEFTIEPRTPARAVPALVPGAAAFAAASREYLDEEKKGHRAKYGHEALAIAVAGASYSRLPTGFTDAMTFFVNKDNPLEKITLAQLDAIYSTTRKRGYKEDITKWGQLGLTGRWAEAPVIPYGVEPGGFEQFIKDKVLLGGEYKAQAKTTTTGINIREQLYPLPFLVGYVRDAIGYAGFSYVNCATTNIKSLAIAEGEEGPYYKGTFDEVLSQKYPLSRVIYVVVNKAPEKSLPPQLSEFLRFILSREGQQIVVEDGLWLPLPAERVRRELAKLE